MFSRYWKYRGYVGEEMLGCKSILVFNQMDLTFMKHKVCVYPFLKNRSQGKNTDIEDNDEE